MRRPDRCDTNCNGIASVPMMNMNVSGLAGLAMLCAMALGGCGPAIQTSSGADFVAARPEWAARFNPDATPARTTSDVDREIFEAARAEPLLRFPARIGLARLQSGYLTAIPAEEGDMWLALIARQGQGYGEFVPVSPLVAQMAAGSANPLGRRNPVDMIRIGAARQHVDAVLVYEVGSTQRDTSTPLSVLDLTIIGNFIIPSRVLQSRATAAAMLIDVRNGYPYGTALTHSEEGGMWVNVGSGDRSQELGRRAQADAVLKLTNEIGTMFERLRTELRARDAARPRT
ncbi:hypothetical protein ACVFYP_08460 [Roseomonas sp. F4]